MMEGNVQGPGDASLVNSVRHRPFDTAARVELGDASQSGNRYITTMGGYFRCV